ncbi:hypothetical protein H9P43_005520 [Blastocladiella emersonii ATCC 22665]|nr:hypothetical protein H9P43_005520 [Blastocladiella emersonii ATCC 22665]
MLPFKRKNPLAESDSDDDALEGMIQKPSPSLADPAALPSKKIGPSALLAKRFPMGGVPKGKAPAAAPAATTARPGPSPPTPRAAPPTPTPKPAAAASDGEDDLDAFMAQVQAQAVADRVAATERAQAEADRAKPAVFEAEDGMESFATALHAQRLKRAEDGTSSPVGGDSAAGVDSDEEVYLAAEAMERELAERSGMRGNDDEKREIDPLKPIDHATMEYIEIEKNFYEEHADIAALPMGQVNEIRKKHNIRVYGHGALKPCISFAHFGFDEDLMSAIARSEFTTPSAIQMQAVPLGLAGRDVIGVAATGSGKTLAFLWPMLVHLMDQPELARGEGPIGLVLAPTRELAMQIAKEAKRYATKVYGIRVFCLTGGANKADQWKALRAGVDLLIATPGRLIEMVKNKATNLTRVSYLVLDEADRMLEQGFEAQVTSVCSHVRPDRQTMLFSATFPRRVESLAYSVTVDPIKVVVGGGAASQDVTQVPVVLDDEEAKFMWVLQNLDRFTSVHDFRTGAYDILVATDVAARGLDIKSVRTVICFDPPRDMESHVHRVGRTGRAGEKGTAYSLVTRDQDRFAGELVAHLEASGVADVDAQLLALAMTNGRFAKARRGAGGGNGRGRGRGRGRGGRGGGARGRGAFMGGARREATLLSTGGSIGSSSHASNLLMAAFRPSSKPSESANPPSLTAVAPARPPAARPAAAAPTPASSPSPSLAMPAGDAKSANPLLAALARHQAAKRGGGN